MADGLQLGMQVVPEEELPVCPNCDGEVDGDRYSFLTSARTRCNRIACIRKWEREYDERIRRERDRLVLIAKINRKRSKKRGRSR